MNVYFIGGINVKLGQVLKEIRTNRGYSQQNASHKIISQGVYSKVESGTRDLDAVAFIKIANRMNLTTDEIEFISNGYDYNPKQKILNAFFKMSYNDPVQLEEIKNRTMDYLKKEDDVELREVYLLCGALLIVSDTADYEEARKLIEPIWKRLKMYTQWYLYDIRLINMILFMYPIDQTISISKRVLERLNDYEKHQDVEHLKVIYAINLSLHLIKSARPQEALVLIEERLLNRKQMNFTMLALYLSRRATCKVLLGLSHYEEDRQQAKKLLEIYEAYDLLERIEEEFEKYALNK